MKIQSKAILFLTGSVTTVTKTSAFTVRNQIQSRGIHIPTTFRGMGSTARRVDFPQGNQNALSNTNAPQHQHTQSRLFMGVLKDLFSAPQKAPQDQIIKAFQNPKAVVLDIRSPSEISTKVDAKQWINTPGSPFDCPMLTQQADQLLPDKTAPIILYCASGKRSQKATQILQDKGYEQVYNAGGIGDVEGYLPIVSA